MRKIVKHLPAIMGVIFLAVALLMIVSSVKAEKRCTEFAMATVVDYQLDYDSENRSSSYFPVVEYRAGNKHIKAVASSGSNKRPYAIDSSVNIRYNPDDPYEFVFEGDKSTVRWGIYLVVVAVGLIVLDVLTARGIIKESHTSGHFDSGIHHGPGVTIDINSISEAAKFAKTFKQSANDLKNLSEEDRKALYEALDMGNENSDESDDGDKQ